MQGLVLIFFTLISSLRLSYPTEQIPDLLIIGRDTVELKSFPLEELNFQVRPFSYGTRSYPAANCLRGYQAIWKVANQKLFLADIRKVGDPSGKLDLPQYFAANQYEPVVIDGLIFADWFTMNFNSYPRTYRSCVFMYKTYNVNRAKPLIRVEGGVVKSNRYHSKS